MPQSILKGLQKIENETSAWDTEIAQLVGSLGKKSDIELKTDLPNPLAVAQLKAWARWAESVGFTGTKRLINEFIKDYLELRVSKDRKGRIEIVKAISAINERMKTGLLGKRKEEDSI